MATRDNFDEFFKPVSRVVPTPTPASSRTEMDGADSSPSDDTCLLPEADDDYKPFGVPSNKPLMRLFIIDFTEEAFYRQFQYIQLDSDGDDLGFRVTKDRHGTIIGQEFSVRFGGTKFWKLTVRGRNLKQCYDYISLHRMPWIRRADKDTAHGKEPIITSIKIEEIKEERK